MSSRRSARRYEIITQQDGRWLIDCLADAEIDAIARAEELYADERIKAVRVVRARFNLEGVSFETPIFERVRAADRKPPPLRLAAAPDDGVWCETVEDVYGPASRRTIGRLLRSFLDRFALTPTELLHHQRHIRLLERQESLLQAAIHHIAMQQAKARGLELRTRSAALDGFVRTITDRAREAHASRRLPRLGDGGLAELAAAVAARASENSERAFLMRYAVSRSLEDAGSYADKLDKIASLAGPNLPASLLPLVDELVAGLVVSATVIQDALGYQPHLAAALMAIADLALGRYEGGAEAAPALATVARLCAQAAMPETRVVLLDRLARELASDRPLSREDAAGQRKLLDALLDKLIDRQGLFVGGAAMVEAIARRTQRLEVVGGVESIRFSDADSFARLERLLDLEKQMLAERQQRALATYMADAIDHFEGDPARLLPLWPRIAATGLPETAKQAILDRLPRPARDDQA